VSQAREAIRCVLQGRDCRLVVVVGPCSIHDPEATLDYAARLKALAREVRHCFVLVMRTCFEKPRSNGGWKGLVSDPRLDGSCDIEAGLTRARGLLLDINDLGVPCATEFLDPLVAPYLADLVSWGWIGARTSESQVHRALASGLPMPVGFKNGTDGRIETAANAVLVARQPHTLLGISPGGRIATVLTPGNLDTHVVLRGGCGGPNFGPEHVERVRSLVAGTAGRPVLIDCSHDNSGKDPAKQGAVFRTVLSHFLGGQRGIMGLALESNLLPGKQAAGPLSSLRRGVSVTDACIGWEETTQLIQEAARLLDASPASRTQ